MAFTAEQYEAITDKLDSDDFYNLSDLALTVGGSNHYQDFDKVHELSKKALDYEYTEESKETLENLLDEIFGLSSEVLEAIEALEKIEEVLSKA